MRGEVLADLPFAIRSLAREPRFTALVTGVMAAGLALVVGVYAVVDAYLLAPLPFPHPERLVSVGVSGDLSWDEVGDVFEKAVSWDLDVFTVVGDGRPEVLRGAWITPDFLDTYGITAAMGRGFLPEEAGRDAAPVAMISHDLWRDRFGSDPGVVGRSFRAFTSDRPEHAELFTIVGVLPRDFWYVNEYTQVFAPIRSPRTVYAGRLRPDVPIGRARQVLTEMARARETDLPPGFTVELEPLKERYVSGVRPTLLALQAAVLLVLLVACANAGVLLLIRTARREGEFGVRRALGASDWRLARQLLMEGAMVAGLAGVLGAGLATWGLRLVRGGLEATLGQAVPGGLQEIALDGSVLLAAGGLCAVVAVAFGTLPLLSRRESPFRALTTAAQRGSDSAGSRRARSVLVATEVALSLALLTGAGLMVRSALFLQHQELGFEPAGVVRGEAGLRAASYPEPGDRVAFFSSLVEQAGELPGVESAAVASRGLFSGRARPSVIEAERDGIAHRTEAVRWAVGERYFETLRIPVLRGRGLQETDGAGSESVVVISASLAQAIWPGESAVGRFLRISGAPGPDVEPAAEEGWRRVIGVVADVAREIGGAPVGDVYEPYRQASPLWMNVLVRGSLSAAEAREEVASILAGLDPEVPLHDVHGLDAAVARALAPSRDLATMLATFAAFAFGLAVLGLYGVVSYAARQSRRNVAIRMALGAGNASVTGLFVRQALVLVAVGVVVGWFGGLGLGRMMAGQLHGVDPADPLLHGSLAAVLGLTSLVAAWLPARRASRTDPMEVLREE